jgi:hypothetical protein
MFLAIAIIIVLTPFENFFVNGLIDDNHEGGITNVDGATDPKFSKPVNLSNNPNDSVYGQVAAIGDIVYVVWEEDIIGRSDDAANGRNYDIYFMKSTDGGSTFGKKINLSNNLGFSEHPQIAIQGSNVYIIWIDDTYDNNEKVLFRASKDYGNSFGNILTVSENDNNGNITGKSYNAELAASANNVYVVWERNSTEIGLTTRNLSSNRTSYEQYNQVLIRTSNNSGDTFNDIGSIANNVPVNQESYPKIAAFRDSVNVVWSIGTIPTQGSFNNALRNNGYTSDSEGIFSAKSSNNATTFGLPLKISHEGNPAGESQVAIHGNNVYIVWSGNADYHIPNKLFFTKSNNGGDSFSEEIALTDRKSSLNAEIVADRNSVYIPWQTPLKEDGNEDILITKGTDIASTFTHTIEKNISNNNGISECPSIAISNYDNNTDSNNYLYVVWEDNTLGNHEIFLSKSRA